MTDEEIEKVLSALSESTCDNLDTPIEHIAQESLAYITHLKDEIIALQNECFKKETEKKQIKRAGTLAYQSVDLNRNQTRKETAKEIFQKMFELVHAAEQTDLITVTSGDIKSIAAKYGVEVDE